MTGKSPPSRPEIVFMLSRYSGLVESIDSGHWRPTGVPAIARILEAVADSEFTARLILYDPTGDARPMPREIALKGLDMPIRLLSGRAPRLPISNGATDLITRTGRALAAIKAVRARPGALFYTDRGNILAAAAVARFTPAPVVLRLLGITPQLAAQLGSRRPIYGLYRWAYRSPFRQVIGTEDGSAIRPFLSRALAPDTPCAIRLNGLPDLPQSPPDARQPLELIVAGRLAGDKRVDTILEGFARLSPDRREKCRLTLAGSGPDETALRSQAADLGVADRTVFLGALPHDALIARLKDFDVYISMNRYGQASNTNQEACAAGLALILGASEGDDAAIRESLFPADHADWLPSNDPAEDPASALAARLAHYIDNPQSVLAAKRKARALAARIGSWQDRIAWEMDLLRNIAKTAQSPQD